MAPLTQRIGLIPTVNVTHTEPFHIRKTIATLDYVSLGRAGVRVQVSAQSHVAAHFGRRTDLEADDLFREAADYVEVVRRLWDSWEDDAEIRDVATGRFVDRDKLHYIDFKGQWFDVKGPSITPRPPQAQPPVMALAHSTVPYRFAAEHADLALITPMDLNEARRILGEIDTTARCAACWPTSLCSSPIRTPKQRHASSGSTSGSGTLIAATRSCSLERPPGWPTCSRSGPRHESTGSAYGPPRCRTTSPRSPMV